MANSSKEIKIPRENQTKLPVLPEEMLGEILQKVIDNEHSDQYIKRFNELAIIDSKFLDALHYVEIKLIINDEVTDDMVKLALTTARYNQIGIVGPITPEGQENQAATLQKLSEHQLKADTFNIEKVHDETTIPKLIAALEANNNGERIKTLNFNDTNITQAQLAEIIQHCPNLESLTLDSCPQLTTLPESIGNLHKLQTLDLTRCTALTTLPDSIENLTALQTIKINELPNTSITKLIAALKA